MSNSLKGENRSFSLGRRTHGLVGERTGWSANARVGRRTHGLVGERTGWSANASKGELHSSTKSRSSDHEVASNHKTSGYCTVGWGNQVRIFVNRRPCSDRWTCRVLTHSHGFFLAFAVQKSVERWLLHALAGKVKEEKTSRQGCSTVRCKLPKESISFPQKDMRSRTTGSLFRFFPSGGATDMINRW